MKQAWDKSWWRNATRFWVNMARMARNRNNSEAFRYAIAKLRDARNESRN